MGFEYTHNGIRLIDTSRGSYTINPNSSSGEPPQIGKVTAILGHSPDYKSFSIRVPSPTGEISKDIPALTITSSKGIPSIGIGVNTPIGNLDILSSGSTPPNLVLRTNQDGVINVGEETGRVRFLIESSSFNLGGLDLAISGSTAEIFSRVTSADVGGVKGSLVFGLSKTSTTANIDAFAIGYEIGSSELSDGDVHAVLSGSMELNAEVPKIILYKADGNQSIAQIGSVNTNNLNEGSIILRRAAAANNPHFVIRNQNDSYISSSNGTNFGIGTSTPKEKLTVEGNISASGDVIVTNVSASELYLSNPSYAGNLRFYQDNANSYQLTSNIGLIFDFGSTNAITTSQKLIGTRGLFISSLGTSNDQIFLKDSNSNSIIFISHTGSIDIGNPNAVSPQINLLVPVTASIISASGTIAANIADNSTTAYKTVVVDPTTGILYRTGSYGGGGGTTITGTNTHVLFFDGDNTPAGDAGLTYNKTTDKLDADGGYTIDGQSFGTYSAGQGMKFGNVTNVKNAYEALGHLFTTPISASIVSASDSINTKVYYINDTQALVQPTQGQLDISDNSLSNLYRGTDHNFITSITSSAEISASGDLYGYDVHAGNNFVLYDDIGIINEAGGTIYFGNNSYPTGYKGTAHLFGTIVYLDTLKASGAITASGGISASFLEVTTNDANGAALNTLMIDTTSGRIFHTGSYGGGGGGGGGSGTVTEVTVGAGLDVTNGTTTPNITLDLTEITLSNGLDSTTTGLSLDLTEVIANGTNANLVLTSDGDGTLTAEPGLGFDGKLIYPNSGDIGLGNFGTYYDLVDDIESNADLFVGDIAAIGSAITTTAGYVCNLSGSWAEARANSLSTSTGLLGIATVSVSSNEFLLRGYFSIDDGLIQGNPVIGSPIYINAAQSGKYAFSPPSAGNVSRIIGHLVDTWTPDRGANYYYKIYFNPSPEWIET